MVPFACMPSPIPGRSNGIYSLVRFHSLRPSHEPGRVGSCIVGFGACSAFTHVTACTLAKSPSDSLHQRLQQSRCLHCCSDCYRVERTSSRAGLPPLWTTAFSRRTRLRDLTSKCLRFCSRVPPSNLETLLSISVPTLEYAPAELRDLSGPL